MKKTFISNLVDYINTIFFSLWFTPVPLEMVLYVEPKRRFTAAIDPFTLQNGTHKLGLSPNWERKSFYLNWL